MVTLHTACETLGISAPTLRLWIARLKIAPAVYDFDKRIRLLTPEQLAAIATAIEDHRRIAHPAQASATPRQREKAVPPAIPPRRQRLLTENLVQSPLPEGWIAFSSWCLQHHVNQRSAQRIVAAGQMVAPHVGEWKRGQYGIRSAYSPEQHAEASATAATRWSGRFRACELCG